MSTKLAHFGKIPYCLKRNLCILLDHMDKIVHFEVPFENEKRVKDFYGSVFGWTIKNIPEMKYASAITGPSNQNGMPSEAGYINGGLTERNNHIRSPVITISVQSIDESIKNIEVAGGKIVKPKVNVGEMGFAAYFEDTEGNIIGLWQNKK
jgi:uncharacterized protein